MTALWGTLFQLAISSFSWMDAAMEGVREWVGQMMETEADREPEEEKSRRRTLSMEDLRRKYSWWPSGERREGQPGSLIDVEAADSIALKVVKSTKLYETSEDDIARGVCWTWKPVLRCRLSKGVH